MPGVGGYGEFVLRGRGAAVRGDEISGDGVIELNATELYV